MKTAISVPDDLFEAAEETAKRLKISRSELYATAVRSFLRAEGLAQITEQIDRVYSSSDSRVDPVLMAMQLASLEDEQW